MRTRTARDLPAELEGLRRRFERWRRTRQGRTRIPEALWASAVKAARTHGLHRTAKALRLDYYALKKRVELAACATELSRGAGSASGNAPDRQALAAFLELTPPASSSVCECIVELENAAGARMRIHVKGVEVPDLAGLSRSFWRVEP